MERYTRRQILILATFAIANFCSALCGSLQAPFYPLEAEKKGATPTECGFVFGIYELVIFLISPVYGKYIRVIGPSFLLSAGLFMTGAACVLFGFLDKIYSTNVFVGMSLTIRVFEGLGNAGVLTATFSLIAAEFPDALGAAFALIETFYGAGLISGPTIGGALYEIGGYMLPFLCFGITLVSVSIVIFLISPKDIGSHEINNKENNSLGKLIRIPLVCIFVYVSVVTAGSLLFLQATLEPHLRQFGLTPFHTGLMFFIEGGAYALTAPIWGILSDKYILPQYIVGVGCLLTSIAFLLVGPAYFIPLNSSLPLCIGSLVLQGIGVGSEIIGAFSGTQKEAINYGLPDNIETYGLVSGMWTSAFYFGAFLGPLTAGYLYEKIGFRRSTLIVVGLHLLGFISLLIYSCYNCHGKIPFPTNQEEFIALLGGSPLNGYGLDSGYCDNSDETQQNNRSTSSDINSLY